MKERDDLMVNIIKQKIDIEEALKKKLEFKCSYELIKEKDIELINNNIDKHN